MCKISKISILSKSDDPISNPGTGHKIPENSAISLKNGPKTRSSDLLPTSVPTYV